MYHFTVKTLSRRRNQSVVAAAAYRSGERLYDERSERFSDFTKKKGVVFREILLPSNASPEFRNREVLWNTVEAVEKRKDARLAREAEVALPREFSLEEQVALVKSFVLENFVAQGMCADVCIHHKNEKNPHAHILLTDRPVDCNGFAEKKDPTWNRKELLVTWRESWARILNEGYRQKGLEKRVTHESYETLGIIDRKPTKHLGPRVLAHARHHRATDRILEHIEILHSGAEKERFRKMLGINRERTREHEHERPNGRSR